MSIDAVTQINKEVVTGTKSVSSNNTVMTSANLNRTNGTAYSTSNAGTEELEQNEKIDKNYVNSVLYELFNSKNYCYIDKNGNKKPLDLYKIQEELKKNPKFAKQIDKLCDMTKKEFKELVTCLKAALKDAVKGDVIDLKVLFTSFTYYNNVAIKSGESDCSIQERIENARKVAKQYEGKSLGERLGNIDVNNEEELEEALKDYLYKSNLKERLENATTKEEKQEILKEQIRNLSALIHGVGKEDLMRIGVALLKVVKNENLVEALDIVADMLIPDGLREKYISMINNSMEDLVASRQFSREELQNLAAYLGKNSSFEENKESLEKINDTLVRLAPVYQKVQAAKMEYIKQELVKERKRCEITEEEIIEHIKGVGITDEEIKNHQTYELNQSVLEARTAGITDSEATDEEKQILVQQAYQIAQDQGFGEEFLQGINEYIKEHGEEFDIPQNKINEILNNATEGQYSEVTGESAETQSETQEVAFGVTEEVAGGLIPTEEVTQAQENAQTIKDQIATQTNAANETSVAEVKSAITAEGSASFFSMAADKAQEVKDNTVKHYANIEQAVKENTKAKFSEIKKMTGEATGVLVEYIFTTQNISDNLLNGAKTRFDSLLSCVKQNIASSGNLTREAVAIIEKDNSTKQFLADRYRKNDEKQQMGV